MRGSAKKKREKMPINREVLRWARERLKLSFEDVAEELGVKPEQVQDWELGGKLPTVLQARRLAEVYDRPFLEFFAKENPAPGTDPSKPAFRMHRDAESPKERHELILIQSEAEEIRLNALDLFELLGEEPPPVPNTLFAKLSDEAGMVAARARDIIELPIAEQLGLKSAQRDDFPKILRRKIEAKGILVAKNSGLQHFGARGMCIFAVPLPIIVFSNEPPSAQAFTLAHELAHIALRQSGVSGPPGSAASSAKKLEDWCDSFAAALLFLLPPFRN
jgi:transcriptional regulator with XRE-family HTH domain